MASNPLRTQYCRTRIHAVDDKPFPRDTLNRLFADVHQINVFSIVSLEVAAIV